MIDDDDFEDVEGCKEDGGASADGNVAHRTPYILLTYSLIPPHASRQAADPAALHQHKAITKLPATKAKMWSEVLELRDEHTELKAKIFKMTETISRQERQLEEAEDKLAADTTTIAELRNEVKELSQSLMDTRRSAEGERREAQARLKDARKKAEEDLQALAEAKGVCERDTLE